MATLIALLAIGLGITTLGGGLILAKASEYSFDSWLHVVTFVFDCTVGGMFLLVGGIMTYAGVLGLLHNARGAAPHPSDDPDHTRDFSCHEDVWSTTLRIRGPRNWFKGCFLGLWLTGWSTGASALVFSVVTVPMPVWMRAVTFFVAVIVCGVAWLILIEVAWDFAGREIVRITSTDIHLCTDMRVAKRIASFPLRDISKLRIEPGETGRVDPIRTATVAFDAEGSTYRFGAALDEATAQRVVIAVQGAIARLTSNNRPDAA